MKKILKNTFSRENFLINGIVIIGCVLIDFVSACIDVRKERKERKEA